MILMALAAVRRCVSAVRWWHANGARCLTPSLIAPVPQGELTEEEALQMALQASRHQLEQHTVVAQGEAALRRKVRSATCITILPGRH